MTVTGEILHEMKYDLTADQYRKLELTLEKVFLTQKNTLPSNNELVDRFIENRRLCGLSELTLQQYVSSLRHFFFWLNGRHCTSVTRSDCNNYIIYYKNYNNVQQITVVNKIGFLSPFYDWLEKEDYIMKNPWKLIDKIKVPRKQKEAFTSVELSRIRDNCTNKRDRAIVEFLCSTGVRAHELVSITFKDVNFVENEVLIRGKGSKERFVYLSDTAKWYLDQYLKDRHYKSGNDPLFASFRKESQLTNKSLEDIVKNLCKPLDIHGHPHKFRRTFCTNMINRGLKINHVQTILGHSNIQTTMGYYAIDKTNTHRSYNQVIN